MLPIRTSTGDEFLEVSINIDDLEPPLTPNKKV